MTRKRRSPEEIVAKLRQVEALRLKGKTCAEAVQSIGVSEVTYRRWRGEFGGLIRILGPNHASVENRSLLIALLQRMPAEGVENELDPAFARDLTIPRFKSTVLWSIG
jgi:hypothetical protein